MSEEPLTCGACNKPESDTLKLLHCRRCKNETYCGKHLSCSQTLHSYSRVLGAECQTKHWPTHKAHCKPPNYILKFHLYPDKISNPSIWRTLSCPADATFQDLHEALQIAFGYASTHTYDFRIKDLEAERQREEAASGQSQEEAMADMIAKLTGTVGNDINEAYLGTRSLLRIVDPDTGEHIDRMHAMHRRHKNTPEKRADRLKLHQVLDDPSYRNAPMQYEYDFGDCWEHQMTHETRAEKATDFFQCKTGEGHGVAEDVGSANGWEELKLAYRSSRPSEDQKEKMDWFENLASNEDRHGLDNGGDRRWPKTKVNSRLAELAGKVVGFT